MDQRTSRCEIQLKIKKAHVDELKLGDKMKIKLKIAKDKELINCKERIE